ncbi:MAG: LamG domain-containing protein [Terracidiphilus sp.]|nr:LamG domain-containing protein [Terracidiphilus sp.]
MRTHSLSSALFAALLLSVVSLAAAQTPAPPLPAAPTDQIWRFDSLTSIGGHPVQLIGHPQLIDSPYGKAIQFGGAGDGLFLPVHPLAGASAYTWEVIFRPDADGPQAQRFFHLQEQDPTTGEDTKNRMLFEIRIVDGKWCLDSFASSGPSNRTLLACDASHLYPLGQWYRVTAVYDGKTLTNYVGNDLQGSGPLDLKPQFPGRTSIGIRINKLFPFKGAVLVAHMTPRVLTPPEFLPMPQAHR